MKITYGEKSDLLYILLDETAQEVVNKRVDEDIVLDLGADDRIVGIEILDASRRVRLDQLASLEYERTA